MTLYTDSNIAIEQMKKDGGHGKALFDDLEFDVYPGLTMIAPAGTKHAIKRNPDSTPVKVFWFHSAV